jgi:putative FmdB family regulatory protein
VPTYQYACTRCAHALEVVQSFTDEALTECPVCAGRLRKVFSAVGVVFKGSGFYRTDSRTAAASSGDGGTKTETKTESTSAANTSSAGESSSSTTAPAKAPAAA